MIATSSRCVRLSEVEINPVWLLINIASQTHFLTPKHLHSPPEIGPNIQGSTPPRHSAYAHTSQRAIAGCIYPTEPMSSIDMSALHPVKKETASSSDIVAEHATTCIESQCDYQHPLPRVNSESGNGKASRKPDSVATGNYA